MEEIRLNKGGGEGRALNPEYYCHKFGYTPESLTKDLKDVGFKEVIIKHATPLIRVLATKEKEETNE